MNYHNPTDPRPVIPAVESGYELDASLGWFSLVMPEASTNLCLNPSFEVDTAGWGTVAGTLTRTSAVQRWGTYAGKLAPTASPNDGVYYGATPATLVRTVPGQWYTASIYFQAVGGQSYSLYWADANGNLIGSKNTFYALPGWQRASVSLYEGQASIGRRVYLTKNGSTGLQPIYVDGCLIENKPYATTYFDGDSVGYVTGVQDFWWNGARHASTSGRSASTRAGGRPMKLQDMGFVLMSIIGLSMAPVQPTSQTYGWQDGALYQRTRLPERTFTLAGSIQGSSQAEVKRTKALIESYLLPAVNPQPILLQYEYADETGRPTGEVLNLPSVYSGGMEGKTEGLYAERAAPKFTMYLPLVQKEGNEGMSLGFSQTVNNTAYAAARIDGKWQALGTGFNGGVYCVRVDSLKRVWYSGSFTTANGTTVNGVTYWDGAKFVAVGGAIKGVSGGTIVGMAPDANGNMWLFGTFSAAGGASTKGIARWNAATDTFTTFNLAGAVTGFYGGVVDNVGTVYAWGIFTGWNGDANQKYITSYTTAGVWTALAGNPYSSNEYPYFPNCGVIDARNHLIIGDLSSGILTAKLYDFNGTSWTMLGETATGVYAIYCVYIGPDSSIYISGNYAILGGLAVPNGEPIKYNGKGFTSLSAGWYSGYVASDLAGYGSGELLAGTSSWQYLLMWNGSYWIRLDIINLANGLTHARTIRDNIYLGWEAETGTTSTVSGLIAVTNTGSENANPIFTFTGPGNLYWIKNETTGDLLSFNLTLQAGEVATLDMSRGNISFISSFRGNILSTLLAGSNDATFRLVPGVNNISVFVAGTTTAATAVDMRWTPQYLGLEH